MQQLIERRGIDPHHRFVLGDQPLAHHFDGDFERGFRRALAAARLEHEEFPLLHRELDVLHVAVVSLEHARDALELGEGVGNRLFHGHALGARRLARALGDRLRGADAGDDVLALRIDQELAVKCALAGRGIARESDARRGRWPAIAEHHRLDVDCCSPIFGDVVQAPIGLRPRAHPGAEHGANRAP